MIWHLYVVVIISTKGISGLAPIVGTDFAVYWIPTRKNSITIYRAPTYSIMIYFKYTRVYPYTYIYTVHYDVRLGDASLEFRRRRTDCDRSRIVEIYVRTRRAAARRRTNYDEIKWKTEERYNEKIKERCNQRLRDIFPLEWWRSTCFLYRRSAHAQRIIVDDVRYAFFSIILCTWPTPIYYTYIYNTPAIATCPPASCRRRLAANNIIVVSRTTERSTETQEPIQSPMHYTSAV